MKAVWNGAIVADSDKTRVIEGNYYFPPDSINRKYFKASKTTSICPWRGQASYYTLEGRRDKERGRGLAVPDTEGGRSGDQRLHRVLARRRDHRIAGYTGYCQVNARVSAGARLRRGCWYSTWCRGRRSA